MQSGLDGKMKLSEKHEITRNMAMTANNQQATITAKYVNDPKPGGKYGNVKDEAGQVWFAEPYVLGEIKQGSTVIIEYAIQKWQKGPVNVVSRVLDAAPRTHGTEAPQIVTDKDTRIFVSGFLQYLFQGSGNFPGAQELQEIIYATRCAYETAFGRPVKILTPRSAPAVPVPRQGEQGTARGYQAHEPIWQGDHPDDLPP